MMVSDPHVDRMVLNGIFGDRVVSMIDGLDRANVVVFLVAHDRFKLLDRKLLEGKRILDFCGALYEASHQAGDEHMFWPAHSVMDFFIVNQSHEGVDSP